MTSPAEQYRALVSKLEAITEAPVEAPAVADAQAASNTAPADATAAPAEAPAAPAAAPTNEIPTLGGTFKQAYAQAAKQGLKQFKWCGTYAVKAPVTPQQQGGMKKQQQGISINSPTGNGQFVGGIGLPTDQPVYQPGA
jgi:hypothetical protein